MQGTPLFTPDDHERASTVEAAIFALITGGGEAWRNDSRILAEAACYGADSTSPVIFVTEDRHHIGQHGTMILTVSGLSAIQDLEGADLCSRAAVGSGHL